MNLKNPRKLDRIFDEPYVSLYEGVELNKLIPSREFIFAEELVHQTNGVKH